MKNLLLGLCCFIVMSCGTSNQMTPSESFEAFIDGVRTENYAKIEHYSTESAFYLTSKYLSMKRRGVELSNTLSIFENARARNIVKPLRDSIDPQSKVGWVWVSNGEDPRPYVVKMYLDEDQDVWLVDIPIM